MFPSYGLNALDDAEWVAAHEAFGQRFDRFIGFELGPMFVPYGRIYSLAAYEGLLGVASCIGAKHSSLSRALEWDRLAVRDRVRPDFHVFTGNDLAIDMVCYGSDYLLGLSAFAPDAFAERDRRWAAGDRAFHELNDLLQYLGAFAFRAPVPAYRHDAALFLSLRGRIASDATPSGAPRRPDSDRAGPRRHRRTARGDAVTDRHRPGEAAPHARRAARPVATRSASTSSSASTTPSTRRAARRRRSRSPTVPPAPAPSATGSRCCRWRAGTATPTVHPPTWCAGGGAASARAEPSSSGAVKPSPSPTTGAPTPVSS